MADKRAVEPALAARSRKLRREINLYPPYLGAAVRVTQIADDFRHIEVEMPLRFYNRNYFRHAFRRIALFHVRSLLCAHAGQYTRP